jgi:hypothetical protein
MVAANYTWFRLKDAIVTDVCAILCVLAIAGCGKSDQTAAQTPLPSDTPASYSLDSVLDSLGTSFRGASSNVAPQAEAIQARTKEEWSKLFRWEYRVVDIAANESAPDFEAKLAELGQEGWEVFSIITQTESVRITCKRRPPSALAYLKYVPGL